MKAIKILPLLIVSLFLLNMGFAQECADPTSLSTISESAVLCSGTYDLPDGITISANNIKIECLETVLNLPGDKNGFAFYMENKDNVTIRGCTIQNYQSGIEIIYSNNIMVTDCSINNNIIGIKVENSNENSIQSNSFIDNEAFDIFMNEENRFNVFETNEFNKGFNIGDDDIYNSYVDNNYGNTDAQGPRGTQRFDPVLKPEPTNDPVEPVPLTGKKIIIIEDGAESLDSDGRVIDEEYIIRKAYEAEGNDDTKAMERDIEMAKKIKESLNFQKALIIDYDERSTSVQTNITVVKDISGLEIYEYIPKCLVAHVDEMQVTQGKIEVIEEDPLIVWNHGDVKEGDTFEHSYKVNKVFNRTPTTLAVSDVEGNLAFDECACGTGENPLDIPCSECVKKKKFNILAPLLLIPLIAFVVVFFNRFEQKK